MGDGLVFGVLTARGNNYIFLDDKIEEGFDASRVIERKDISIDGENYVFFNEDRVSKRFVMVNYVPERSLWRG